MLSNSATLLVTCDSRECYEETAQLAAVVEPEEIEARETSIETSQRVDAGLPFDHAELLVVDRIGKDISNWHGHQRDRPKTKRSWFADEFAAPHHIYVRV